MFVEKRLERKRRQILQDAEDMGRGKVPRPNGNTRSCFQEVILLCGDTEVEAAQGQR